MAEYLTDDELVTALSSLPDWSRRDGSLVRDVVVDGENRDALLRDLRAVGEDQGRQPDVERTSDGVRISIAGEPDGGITPADLELAAAVDQVISGTARDESA